MSTGQGGTAETRQAMFWAALAAQCAGEPHVTANRIAAALLRTPSATTFCTRSQIDSAVVCGAADDPERPSFADCEREVSRDLAERGVELGSREHQATLELRPLHPIVKPVFDAVVERREQFAIPPLELLLALIDADPALAERLARHGMTAGRIRAALAV